MKMNSIVPCTVYRVRVDCCVRNSYRGKPIVLPPPAEASSAAPSLSSRKMTNPPKSASGLLHSRLVLMDRLLLLRTSDVCGRVRPLVTASAMRCSRELAFLILLLSTRSVTELCSRRLPRLCVAMVVVGGSPLLASVWVASAAAVRASSVLVKAVSESERAFGLLLLLRRGMVVSVVSSH